MSQNNSILQHLKSGKAITATQAIKLFSCYRLAARIKELKDKGYVIASHTQRRGDKSWSVYKMEAKK